MTTLEILNILQHDIHSTVWTSRVCPVGCISPEAPRKIDAAHCLHCGSRGAGRFRVPETHRRNLVSAAGTAAEAGRYGRHPLF